MLSVTGQWTWETAIFAVIYSGDHETWVIIVSKFHALERKSVLHLIKAKAILLISQLNNS